ncbi:MAG: hypothetical protein HN348_31720, partial [Proteobacteria bacterium]|nr:hypothetical protein [Pseudomonadota bacterium]
KLRQHPSISKVAVVDAKGHRVPRSDTAPAPTLRGLGRVFTIRGDEAVGAYPLQIGETKIGYLAVILAYPRNAILWRMAWLAMATMMVMVFMALVAWVVSYPATRELRRVAATIQRLGKGETWIPDNLREGWDEIGRLGTALRDLSKRLDQAAELRAHRHIVPQSLTEDVDAVVNWAEIHPRELLEAVVEQAQDKVRQQVSLVHELDLSSELTMKTDGRLVSLAVEALLENAVEHTVEGRITLSAFVSNDDFVTIMVQDTGPGLSERALRHLYRPMPHVEKGFGVGLALASRYAKSLGGRLTHDGRYSAGSRFLVRLPKLGGP